LRERTANALVGVYPIETAVHMLFEGTDLTSVVSDSGVVTIAVNEKNSPKGNDMKVESRPGFVAFLAAMFVGGGASAQEGADPAADEVVLEEVIVTGSRVARTGFDTPTPTTIIDTSA